MQSARIGERRAQDPIPRTLGLPGEEYAPQQTRQRECQARTQRRLVSGAERLLCTDDRQRRSADCLARTAMLLATAGTLLLP